MDSSLYVPTQTTPMLHLIGGNTSIDDQPVNYGPMLWDVMNHVASDIGGSDYLVGAHFTPCDNRTMLTEVINRFILA